MGFRVVSIPYVYPAGTERTPTDVAVPAEKRPGDRPSSSSGGAGGPSDGSAMEHYVYPCASKLLCYTGDWDGSLR